MKRFLLVCLMVLIAVPASAELWICYNKTTIGTVTYEKPQTYAGDCKALNLCTGLNNTGLKANCFEATQAEFDEANKALVKAVPSNSVGERIVALSKEDTNAIAVYNGIVAKEAQETQAENLEVGVKDVITSFINIYNSKMPVQYRVTTDELKAQIKTDLGIE